MLVLRGIFGMASGTFFSSLFTVFIAAVFRGFTHFSYWQPSQSSVLSITTTPPKTFSLIILGLLTTTVSLQAQAVQGQTPYVSECSSKEQ
jgi:hypothetical protein